MNNHRIFIIAAITALLKRLLNNEIIRQFAQVPIGDVTITALPPDRIPLGAEERAQLNLSLYRVTPNSARQYVGGSAQHEAGPAHLPLALDLHYLLAAYGEKELQTEALLGCAAQLFHEHFVLTPEMMRSLGTTAQNGGNPDPLLEMLPASTFLTQMQPVKITPEFLNIDDLSKIWSSLQAHARPALTYRVSMVLLGEGESTLDKGAMR